MHLKDAQMRTHPKAAFVTNFYFAILKLLLLIYFFNGESRSLCRNIKTEGHAGDDKKASLSNAGNGLLGDPNAGPGRERHALTLRPFPGYLALKASCSNPAKIKGSLRRL